MDFAVLNFRYYIFARQYTEIGKLLITSRPEAAAAIAHAECGRPIEVRCCTNGMACLIACGV